MMINLTQELNNEQAQAVLNPIDACTKIVAGAGTGKTKIIAQRALKLVLQDAITPEQILVITFTDKAAAEMRERIINQLQQHNINFDEKKLAISTFHSFCSKILAQHLSQIGVEQDYTLASQDQLKATFDEIIDSVKQNNIPADFLACATELQLPIDIFDIDNLLKLTKIADLQELFESVFLIIKKIKSYGLTPYEFLQKSTAAAKLYSKTLTQLSFGYQTKDDYCANWQQVLGQFASTNINIDEIAKSKTVLDKNSSTKPERWAPASGFPELLPRIDDIETYFTKFVTVIYAIYQERLRKQSSFDFDDLINKTLELLKHNNILREFYQDSFKHIIVDEFQDTNTSQLELIKLLINENYPNITFVGDRKQSIYGFRHAQMENLDSLHRFVQSKFNQKFPEIKLKTNYRSSPDVIAAVNFVTEKILELDENLQAFKSSEHKDYVKTTKFCEGKNTSDLKLQEAQFIAQEILQLMKDTRANLNQTHNQNPEQQQGVNFKDFAVLVKSHFQADFIERVLAKSAIPSVKKVNSGYFQRPLVKDVMAMFMLLLKHPSEQALIRVLLSKIPQADLYRLVLDINDAIRRLDNPELFQLNLYEKILLLEQKPQALLGILEFIEQNQERTLIEIFHNIKNYLQLDFDCDIIASNKIAIEYRVLEMIIEDFQNRRKYVNVFEFVKFFENLPSDSNYTLPNPIGEDIDAVNLLTVHASKGLEFDYVFLTAQSNRRPSADGVAVLDLQYGEKSGFGLMINKFEGRLSPKMALYKSIWQSPRDKAEKDRLFYVALSRAKKYLNVLTFDEIKLYGHLIEER